MRRQTVFAVLLLLSLAIGLAASEARDLVYRVPGMDRVLISSNLTYKKIDGIDLKADLYLPMTSRSNAPLPVIIYVLGDASAQTLRDAKDWRFLQSYGRLAAASGFAGITFNHRSSENFTRLPDVRRDITDLIEFVRTNATTLLVDKDRLCLWFFSGSGPHLGVTMGPNAPHVRCVVAYYPLLVPDGLVGEEVRREFSSSQQLKRFAPAVPPMLLVKAGRDAASLNGLLNEFRTVAEEAKVPVEYLEHTQGQHAFDIFDDDDRSREILRRTMDFLRHHCRRAK